MEILQFKNLIAFLVLMENNEGVLDKSPDYVIEKYERFLHNGYTDETEIWGLDSSNTEKFKEYFKKWISKNE